MWLTPHTHCIPSLPSLTCSRFRLPSPFIVEVVAIEHDPRMVVELQKRVHGTELAHKLSLTHADFMQATA